MNTRKTDNEIEFRIALLRRQVLNLEAQPENELKAIQIIALQMRIDELEWVMGIEA